MKDNFAWIAKQRPGMFAVLNSGPYTTKLDEFGIGRMSYPNFGGGDKSLHNPDVRLLARLAEEGGADLRIIVLVRTPEEILRSTVFHRHFGPEQRQASILALSASLLAAQLAMIDPKFFVCVNSSVLDSMETWTSHHPPFSSSLQETMAINDEITAQTAAILSESAQSYTKTKLATHGDNSAVPLSPVAYEHLAAMTDVLMHVCGMAS